MSTPPAVVSPTGTYTDVTFPDVDGGYDELAWSVTVRTDPSPDGYFWSHQFGLVGGEQAYCGLQTYNAELGGKVAIFSIWRALGARGPQFAATFGGEGTGFSARIRYEWRVDVTYRLTVRRAEAGWWRAEVADPISGRTDEIGEIEVDRAWGGIASRSVMWSERYAGPLRICSDIRHSVVELTDPIAGGSIAATAFHHHLFDPPTCPNSRVDALPNGAVQHMGIPLVDPDAATR